MHLDIVVLQTYVTTLWYIWHVLFLADCYLVKCFPADELCIF